MTIPVNITQGSIRINEIEVLHWIPDQILVLRMDLQQKRVAVETGSESRPCSDYTTVYLEVGEDTLGCSDAVPTSTQVTFKSSPEQNWRVMCHGGRYEVTCCFYRTDLPQSLTGDWPCPEKGVSVKLSDFLQPST